MDARSSTQRRPCGALRTCTGLVLGVWLAASTAGCNGVGSEARRISDGLLGLKAQSLRQCLGDAPFFEIREDGSEVWAYTIQAPATRGDIEIARAQGQGTAFQRPRVEAGNPVERGPEDTSNAVSLRRADRGQCLHVFRVRDGAVQSYTGKGRTTEGLNADAVCTVQLDRCLPAPSPSPDR